MRLYLFLGAYQRFLEEGDFTYFIRQRRVIGLKALALDGWIWSKV